MQVPEIEENFIGSVNRVGLGATKDNGGTRNSTVTVGEARNVIYGGSVEQMSEKLLIAMDVLDYSPKDWPEHLLKIGARCGKSLRPSVCSRPVLI